MATKITGLKELSRTLKGMSKEINEALQPALLKGANEIADAQRRLAPVDDGDLKASIIVTPSGQSTPAHSQPGGSEVVPENAVRITAGKGDVRIAHLVEHGTKPHAIPQPEMNRTLDHPGSEPHPFFWPGYNLRKDKAARRIDRAIRKAITDAWKSKP